MEPNLTIYPYHDTFVDGLRRFERDVPAAFKSEWPRFAFADPFGATGAPFKIVEHLLGNPRAEVLVNLDANGIRRILDAGEAAAGYDEYRDSFPLDGRILDAGITATVEQEIETGRLKGKISLNEMIDYSFINSLGKK